MPDRATLPDVPLSGNMGSQNPLILDYGTRLRVSK